MTGKIVLLLDPTGGIPTKRTGSRALSLPGHDAWVVGNETAVVLDITGMTAYAKPA